MFKLADLEKLINEVAEDEKTSTNKLFTNIRSENEKESKNVADDGSERIKVSTPKQSATQINGYRGEDPPSGRNALNLNYDSIDKKYQERVKALVQGKSSPEQPDIDEKTAGGISVKGNKDFLDRTMADNRKYANVMGTTQINDRIAHPPKSTPKFAAEGKVKIGDTFIKDNLKLKVVGLNEDKTRVSFTDDSGKKYSLSIKTFKKAVNENKMTRGNVEMLNEVAPLIPLAVSGGKALAGAIGGKAALKAAAKGAKKFLKKTGSGIAATAGDTASEKISDKVGKKVGNKVADTVNSAVGADDKKKDDKKKDVKETKIKRLKFNKTTFLNEAHAKSLIPEQYKTPGNKFAMIDNAGNEYMIECDKYQQTIVLEFKNIQKSKKDIENMKRLWEYDSKRAAGRYSLNEEKAQLDIQHKTKKLLEKKNK